MGMRPEYLSIDQRTRIFFHDGEKQWVVDVLKSDRQIADEVTHNTLLACCDFAFAADRIKQGSKWHTWTSSSKEEPAGQIIVQPLGCRTGTLAKPVNPAALKKADAAMAELLASCENKPLKASTKKGLGKSKSRYRQKSKEPLPDVSANSIKNSVSATDGFVVNQESAAASVSPKPAVTATPLDVTPVSKGLIAAEALVQELAQASTAVELREAMARVREDAKTHDYSLRHLPAFRAAKKRLVQHEKKEAAAAIAKSKLSSHQQRQHQRQNEWRQKQAKLATSWQQNQQQQASSGAVRLPQLHPRQIKSPSFAPDPSTNENWQTRQGDWLLRRKQQRQQQQRQQQPPQQPQQPQPPPPPQQPQQQPPPPQVDMQDLVDVDHQHRLDEARKESDDFWGSFMRSEQLWLGQNLGQNRGGQLKQVPNRWQIQQDERDENGRDEPQDEQHWCNVLEPEPEQQQCETSVIVAENTPEGTSALIATRPTTAQPHPPQHIDREKNKCNSSPLAHRIKPSAGKIIVYTSVDAGPHTPWQNDGMISGLLTPSPSLAHQHHTFGITQPVVITPTNRTHMGASDDSLDNISYCQLPSLSPTNVASFLPGATGPPTGSAVTKWQARVVDTLQSPVSADELSELPLALAPPERIKCLDLRKGCWAGVHGGGA
jgi:hypothetical protein